MVSCLMSFSTHTLLTSFKALLQTSYFGESLGVFWQIVCNEVKQEKNQLIYFIKYNKTITQTEPLSHSKLNNAEHNTVDGCANNITIQSETQEMVFKYTESKNIQDMVK